MVRKFIGLPNYTYALKNVKSQIINLNREEYTLVHVVLFIQVYAKFWRKSFYAGISNIMRGQKFHHFAACGYVRSTDILYMLYIKASL